MGGAGSLQCGGELWLLPLLCSSQFDGRVSELIIVETKHLSVYFIFTTKEMSSQVIQALNLNKTQFPCDSYDIFRETVKKLLF